MATRACSSWRVTAKEAVNQALGNAAALLAQNDAPVQEQQRLQKWQTTWQALEQAVASNKVEVADSFARHTDLIAELMMINEELLVAYRLQSNEDLAMWRCCRPPWCKRRSSPRGGADAGYGHGVLTRGVFKCWTIGVRFGP